MKPPRLHRNNAAEWAMVFALTPLAWAVRLWDKVRRRPEATEPGGSAVSSSVPTMETP